MLWARWPANARAAGVSGRPRARISPIEGCSGARASSQNAAAADVELTEDDLRSLNQAVPRAGWAGDRTSFAAVGTSRRTGLADG